MKSLLKYLKNKDKQLQELDIKHQRNANIGQTKLSQQCLEEYQKVHDEAMNTVKDKYNL